MEALKVEIASLWAFYASFVKMGFRNFDEVDVLKQRLQNSL